MDSVVNTPHVRPVATIILPTLNEADGICAVLDEVMAAVGELNCEIIVVDEDSPDETWRVAREHFEELGVTDRCWVMRRTSGVRGLSPSVMAAMAEASGRVFVVADADGQHDYTKIPVIVQAALDGADLVVGSRAAKGGDYGSFSLRRRLVSDLGAAAAKLVTGVEVSDPMSGFFAIHRTHFWKTKRLIQPSGFKIMLEFASATRASNIREVGYSFRSRVAGETKFGAAVGIQFLRGLFEIRRTRHIRKTGRGSATTFDFGDGRGPVPARRHINGRSGTEGGWVADSAYVTNTAQLSMDARVYGRAFVSGDAVLFDSARVHGNAEVFGTAALHERAQVFGNARVYGGFITEDACVFGVAVVAADSYIYGHALVGGTSHVHNSTIRPWRVMI